MPIDGTGDGGSTSQRLLLLFVGGVQDSLVFQQFVNFVFGQSQEIHQI